MAKKQKAARVERLKPHTKLLFVSANDIRTLDEGLISVDSVGEKAFGLSLLPASWTLPFICISADLFQAYKSADSPSDVLKVWVPLIQDALGKSGINNLDPIIVRSSGRTEGLLERGKFYSSNGIVSDISAALTDCLEQLRVDADAGQVSMPLVIQKRCSVVAAKGHLSNERRCYKEPRDWMGEIEANSPSSVTPFQINLRSWRKNIKIKDESNQPLTCSLLVRISKVLEIPATWCSQNKARIHFEWVWDNQRIYLVQADQELSKEGVSPLEGVASVSKPFSGKTLRCIKRATKDHAKHFPKIGNVFTYAKLHLPTAPLYILNDRKIIKALANGNISDQLQNDLTLLLPASLVIRSDVADKNVPKRQLLPRSNELRDITQATSWLVGKSKELLADYPRTAIAFLFHNFIPAASSAFAYAAPGQRNVMIEGLWGIPEGLYYNAHDKYIVDTGVANARHLDKKSFNSFSVKAQQHFKHFFVSPNPNGDWTTKILAPPFDWMDSLKPEWCRYIAYHSRRIAENVNKPVSIMWFAGLKGQYAPAHSIPWHHEAVDSVFLTGSITTRKKTVFDRSQIIRNSSDINALEKALKDGVPVRRIRIQPIDEALLRSKETLNKIGGLAQKLGATIVLEGGILSHAYYQLVHTKAVVEVVHPFSNLEEKHEFNKLVRDNIPAHIESVGEAVKTFKLNGDSLIKALKEKLVEEAFETLDATVQQATLGELADMMEIIDELLQRLELKRDDLFKEQGAKRRSRGGFKNGVVLLETLNASAGGPAINKANKSTLTTQADLLQKANLILKEKSQPPSPKLEKWSDKRKDGGGIELKLNLSIPVLLANWTASTSTEKIGGPLAKSIWGEIKGGRNRSKYTIELSVFIRDTQPDLPLMGDPTNT